MLTNILNLPRYLQAFYHMCVCVYIYLKAVMKRFIKEDSGKITEKSDGSRSSGKVLIWYKVNRVSEE